MNLIKVVFKNIIQIIKKLIKKFISLLLLPFLAYEIIFLKNIQFVLLSPKGRISQYIGYVESVIRENKNGLRIIFINPVLPPNEYLDKLYKNNFNFINLNINSKNIIVKLYSYVFWHILCILVTLPTKSVTIGKIKLFTEDEVKRWENFESPTFKIRINKNEFAKLGISSSDKIVLISYRNDEYYKKYVNPLYSDQSLQIFNVRNPIPSVYIDTIKFLVDRGYKVVKVGLPTSTLELTVPGLIDFSKMYNPELDIKLAKKCLFIINGCSGHALLGCLFNKPMILTHAYSFPWLPLSNNIIVPSIYINKFTNSEMTLSECLDRNLTDKNILDNYHLKHPSSEEVLNATKELVNNIENHSLNFPVKSLNMKYIQNIYKLKGFSVADNFSNSWLFSHTDFFV